MAQAPLTSIYQHIVRRLEAGLPATLTYHSLRHTLDVLQQVEMIAREEKVENEEDLLLLQVSALYHDAGFLETYAQHEEKSSEIAQSELPGFGFSPAQLQTISGLILATKVPQQPQNKLQEILCDADLDYLGRDDFFSIGELLYQEFLHYGVVQDEDQWDQLQVRFLESHRFFTCFSKNNRETQKQRHLQQIKARISQRS